MGTANEIFQDIVNYRNVNPQITFFFENLKASTGNGMADNMIKVLNGILREDATVSKNAGGEAGEKREWLRWIELLLKIHIIKWSRENNESGEKIKNPLFSTFSRTFEHPALYPEYWFDMLLDVKRSHGELMASPAELLTSLERYMYECDGGSCWHAVDFNVNKYIFRCICEPAQKKSGCYEDPCAKIASVIIAAHRIVTGHLGLYVSEAADLNLQYAGLKNDDASILKYHHFDRFTRLSFCHIREKEIDADRKNLYPEFALRWSAIATMTEFSLQNKGARATKTTCSRVSVGTFLKCLKKLRNENALQENEQVIAMLDTGIELLDSEKFPAMSVEEVLAEIKWQHKFITADHYLKKYDIRSAESFWALAEKAFEPFIAKFSNAYFALTHNKSSAHRAANISRMTSNDSRNLLQSMIWDQIDELRGRLTGLRLREALKKLLINGELEFHSSQLWAMLNKLYKKSESFQFFSPQKGRQTALRIPYNWFFTDISGKDEPDVLDAWARDILSEMTRNKKGDIVLNFSRVDFKKIQEASDKTWEIYFSDEYESDVKSRYIISLLTAIKSLEDGDKSCRGVTLISGSAREEFLRFLSEELFSLTGGMAVDLEKEKEMFSQKKLWCYADFSPTWARPILILDILARLVVNIAKNPVLEAVWENTEERVRFVYHILGATHSALCPFPWHLNLKGDAILRLGRGADQRDHITRLANFELETYAEQLCFLMFVGKYLAAEEEPERILQAIIDNPSLSASSADQLEHLKKN